MVGMSECSRFSCKHACRYKTCSYLLGQKGCFHLRMSLCSFFWWQCSCLAYQCSCLPPHICHVGMFISDCSTTQSRALEAFTVLTSCLFLFQISTVLSYPIPGKRLSIKLLEIVKVSHLSRYTSQNPEWHCLLSSNLLFYANGDPQAYLKNNMFYCSVRRLFCDEKVRSQYFVNALSHQTLINIYFLTQF